MFFKMMKIPHKFIIGVLLAAAAICIGINTDRWRDSEDVLSWQMIGKTIVVDAGHGGFDPGAIGISGVEEKDITLAISGKLADILRQSGAVVIETRTDDNALGNTKKEDMAKRLQTGQQSNADLFLMIHGNATTDERYRGAQVFFNKDSEEGEKIAKTIQSEISRLLKNTERSHLALQGIYLMRHQKTPVIIIEVGFLSNAEEEKLLCDTAYQQQMAWAIYSGVVKYFIGCNNQADTI